ncbi:MAG TPA: prepilin-type N-terminal cleavage/methylation domain-containing protein [Armatimonadetes bacterium]|nr:prepilin-type N-terminal cleavage/methylation domain-containing protein [Armatimonadota bacterium]
MWIHGSEHNNRHQQGLTLIELLVTIVILALGLAGVVSMAVVAHSTFLKAHYTAVATQVVQDKMEETLALGYSGVNPEQPEFEPNFSLPELPQGQGTVTSQPYAEGVRLVQVTVQWGGSVRSPGVVSASALITNRP